MKEGSPQDRVISVFSIITTSIPEYASAVFLVGIFVFWLGILPGHLVDDLRVRPGPDDSACTCADALWLRLHRADDARVDGRGDDHALHPDGRAQGPAPTGASS